MKLNSNDELNYRRSCYKLLIMTWICIAVIIFADTLTVFIDAQYISKSIFAADFRLYVLIPAALNVVTMAAVSLLSYLLLKKNMFVMQACLYITGATFICFILARYNQDTSINMVFFVIPVVLAMFYLDRKMLVFGLVAAMIAFAANISMMLSDAGKGINHALLPVSIEVTLVITVIIFVTGMIVIGRSESLHTAAEEAGKKTNEDMLTGYLNHTGFYDDLDETFKNTAREKGEFSLAIIDIDNFTLINDEYGHGFGDEVIEAMVAAIDKSLVNAAKAYRYGGEEFVIICNGQQEVTINMVDSILREFRSKTELRLEVPVTASAGICEYDPKQFKGKRDIFAAVDEALYAAKRQGKNQYAVWNEATVRDSFAGAEGIPEAPGIHKVI